MMTWTNDELERIGSAEELEIASLRRDGTLRDRVTIWIVRVGDNLYVRAVKGRTGPWFRGTQTQYKGRIWASGVEKNVTFLDAEPSRNDQIDAAYRLKYRRYAGRILNSVLTPQARDATIKLIQLY